LLQVDVLDIDVELPPWMAPEDGIHVVHTGNALAGEGRPLPGADVELLQLLPGKIGNAPLTNLQWSIRQDSLEVLIVESRDHAVARRSQVGFRDRAQVPGYVEGFE